MVSASVCTSSGVTPRSKAMRSMPSDFSRRIISPIDSAALRQRHVADDDFLADDADGDRRLIGQQLRERFVEAVEGALHERMRRRIELRGAQRRGELAHEVVRERAGARPDPLL